MISSPIIILSHSQGDRFLSWILRGLSGIAGTIVLLILFFLITEALPVLQHVGIAHFFIDSSWHPTESLYNVMPMVWGTLLAAGGAILVAIPLSIASALFSQYYAPPSIAWLYQRFIELLAGIPSVVYGLWGLMVLVPWIGGFHPPGPSLLAGIVILTIMILPTLALTTDAAFQTVPKEYLYGAAALGLDRWAIIRGVIFPSARSELFTGGLLQAGRAIGETMAVLMVCGNIVQTPSTVFDPIRTLTANIALEMAYAIGDHRSALFVSGLLLLIMVIALITAADNCNRGRVHV